MSLVSLCYYTLDLLLSGNCRYGLELLKRSKQVVAIIASAKFIVFIAVDLRFN